MTLDGGRRRSAPPALTAVRFERTAAKKGEATLARNLLLATLVLWADTVAAEPFGCVSSTGQVRMLVRSPAVCLATETPMSWDPDQPTSGRPRAAVHRPTAAQVGTAALIAILLLPRTGSSR